MLGPILLFGGSLNLLGAARRRNRASIVAVIGSLAVALQSLVWVGPAIGESLRRKEQGFPALWGSVVGVSVLTVLVAYLLYRNTRSQAVPSSVG